MNDKMIQLSYVHVNNGYYVNGIYCSDENMMHRIGEFFTVMNGLEGFYLYDCEEQAALEVEMEPIDNEEVSEKDMDEVGVDTDQAKNIG